MKKKGFMTKVTVMDLLVVCILLITLLVVPAFQGLIADFKPLVYGILCINMGVDLLLVILNKLNKGGNVLQNMMIFFLILKLLVAFMASLVSIVIGLAK